MIVFPWCFKSISNVFQGSFKKIFKIFKRNFLWHGTHRSYPSRTWAYHNLELALERALGKEQEMEQVKELEKEQVMELVKVMEKELVKEKVLLPSMHFLH